MTDALLIGLALILIADYVQIIEEWSERGLTDTSYKVLGMLIVGSLLIAQEVAIGRGGMYGIGFAGFAALAGVMVLWKVKNFIESRFQLLK